MSLAELNVEIAVVGCTWHLGEHFCLQSSDRLRNQEIVGEVEILPGQPYVEARRSRISWLRLMDAFNRIWKARSRRLFAMCSASAMRTSSAIGTFSTRTIASSSAACSSVRRRVIDFGISESWYYGINQMDTVRLSTPGQTEAGRLTDRCRCFGNGVLNSLDAIECRQIAR